MKQSGGALVAAYVLGFLVPAESCTARVAYGVTNCVVMSICLLSLILFYKGPYPWHINLLLILGLFISGVTVWLTLVILPRTDLPSAVVFP